jgi:predicted  nucleic acid-binding Zn-ribbon protein
MAQSSFQWMPTVPTVPTVDGRSRPRDRSQPSGSGRHQSSGSGRHHQIHVTQLQSTTHQQQPSQRELADYARGIVASMEVMSHTDAITRLQEILTGERMSDTVIDIYEKALAARQEHTRRPAWTPQSDSEAWYEHTRRSDWNPQSDLEALISELRRLFKDDCHALIDDIISRVIGHDPIGTDTLSNMLFGKNFKDLLDPSMWTLTPEAVQALKTAGHARCIDAHHACEQHKCVCVGSTACERSERIYELLRIFFECGANPRFNAPSAQSQPSVDDMRSPRYPDGPQYTRMSYDAQKTIAGLEQQLEFVTDERTSMRRQLDGNCSEMTRMHQEREDAVRIIESQQRQFAEYTGEITTLRQQLDSAFGEISHLRHENSTLSTTHASSNADMSTLHAQRIVEREQRGKHQLQYDEELAVAIANSLSDQSAPTVERELRTQINELTEKYVEVQREYQVLNDRYNEHVRWLEYDLEQCRRELRACTESVNSFQHRDDTHVKRVFALEAELEKCRSELRTSAIDHAKFKQLQSTSDGLDAQLIHANAELQKSRRIIADLQRSLYAVPPSHVRDD